MSRPAVEIRDLFRVYPAPEGGDRRASGSDARGARRRGLRRPRSERVGQVDAPSHARGARHADRRQRARPRARPRAARPARTGLLPRRGAGLCRPALLAGARRGAGRAGARRASSSVWRACPKHERLGRAGELLERVGLLDRAERAPARALRRRAATRGDLRGARPPAHGSSSPTSRRGSSTLRTPASSTRRSRSSRATRERRRCSSATIPSRRRSRIGSCAFGTGASARRRRWPTATTRLSSSVVAAGCGSRRSCFGAPESTRTRRRACTSTGSSCRLRRGGRPSTLLADESALPEPAGDSHDRGRGRRRSRGPTARAPPPPRRSSSSTQPSTAAA